MVKDENIQKYALDFATNGGSPLKSLSVEDGSYITPSIYTSSRDGYTSDGWYLDADLQKKITGPLCITGNTTIYAGWQ